MQKKAKGYLVIKALFIFILGVYSLQAAKANRTFDCTKIFEERKSELVERLENLDDQEQALEALRDATSMLLDKKKVKIEAQLSKIKEIEQNTKNKETSIKALMAENEKILKEIKTAKLSKITTMYSKMKAGAAAAIFEKMDLKEATIILNSLPPKNLGKIFAKMKPKKAAELTHEMNISPKK